MFTLFTLALHERKEKSLLEEMSHLQGTCWDPTPGVGHPAPPD